MTKAISKKIAALAARHGWHLTPRVSGDLHLYEVTPETAQQRDAILRSVRRCTGLATEVWNPYCSHSFICLIRIYDSSELSAWRHRQSQYMELTDLFDRVMHDGGTVQQAKAAQLRRAQEIDAMEAYNMIYA